MLELGQRDLAGQDRLIGRSPVPSRVALPTYEPSDKIVPVSVQQVRLIAAQMPARAQCMVVVQAGLGLRIQELTALRKEDVDFLRREVRVRDQLHPRRRIRMPLKTRGSRRTLPLPAVVGDALAAQIAEFGTAPDGELFTMANGVTLWQYDRVRGMYEAAVAAAGLASQEGTHFLRHHYASVLLEAGESVVTVAARLGHTTPALVLSTYGHLMPNNEDRTRKAVDSAWACVPDVPVGGANSL